MVRALAPTTNNVSSIIKNNGAARGGRSFLHFVVLYLKASTLAVSSQMYIFNSLDLLQRCLRHCWFAFSSTFREPLRELALSEPRLRGEKKFDPVCSSPKKVFWSPWCIFTFIAIFVQEANLSKVNDSVFVSHSQETSMRNVRSTASLISRILQQYNNGFKAEFKNTAVEERSLPSVRSPAFPIEWTMETTR